MLQLFAYSTGYAKIIEVKVETTPIHSYFIIKNRGNINIVGEINSDAYDKVKEALVHFSNNRVETIILNLNSRGGSLYYGTKIIDLIEKHKNKFIFIGIVDNKSLCASMCTVIFASLDHRVAHKHSAWIFHSPFSKSKQDRHFMKNVEKHLVIEKSRQFMLAVYREADAKLTNETLESFVLSSGEELVLTAKDLDKISDTWFTTIIQ